MKAVVQRVSSAYVTVAGEEVGRIGHGLLVYLGVGKGDTEAELEWLLGKILGLRIFGGETPEKADKMDRNVLGVSGSLLVVSQFTLYGDVSRGNRPGFDGAMPPGEAERLYERFVERARSQLPVATGRFRSDMLVQSVNEGPVTILLQTP
ncbi:MAG: D-aminoacyl-tRNA deacylase [Polyangiaceae bacterium]